MSVGQRALLAAGLFAGVLCLAAGPRPAFSNAGRFLGVAVQASESGSTLLEVAITGSTPYHVFRLENPRRLVLDLQGAELGTQGRSYAGQGPLVQRVRLGQRVDQGSPVVRLVADLSQDYRFDVRHTPNGIEEEIWPKAEAGKLASAPPTNAAAVPVVPPQAVPVVTPQALPVGARQAVPRLPLPAPGVQTSWDGLLPKLTDLVPLLGASSKPLEPPPSVPVPAATNVPHQDQPTIPAALLEPLIPDKPALQIPASARQASKDALGATTTAPSVPTPPTPAPPRATPVSPDDSQHPASVRPSLIAPPVPAKQALQISASARQDSKEVLGGTAPSLSRSSVSARSAAAPSGAAAVSPVASQDSPPVRASRPVPLQPTAPKSVQMASVDLGPSIALERLASATSGVAPAPKPIAPSAGSPVAPQSASAAPPVSPSQSAAGPQTYLGPQSCGQPPYTGDRNSFNLKDVDLKDFFRLIHEISGLNVVVDSNVSGTVTLALDNVPWDQALHFALNNNGLACTLEGNVLRIARAQTFTDEVKAVPLVTVIRYLHYATASDVNLNNITGSSGGGGVNPPPTMFGVATILKNMGDKVLGPGGTVSADPRDNAVVFSCLPNQVPIVQAVIDKLDQKSKQVSIEARIVLTTSDVVRQLQTSLTNFLRNNSGTVTGGGATGSGSSAQGVPPVTLPSAPSLPTVSQTAPGGFGAYAITNQTARYFISAAISAAETRNQAKTISAPTIVTQNNIPGVVSQGTQIPVQTVINNTVTTIYINATLTLGVTPVVSGDGSIFLNIVVQNNSPGPVIAGTNNPEIFTQAATTQVLIPDGGTVVFGGIKITNNTRSVNQVPGLGDVPIFGHLFKSTNREVQENELIFVITPKTLT